MCVARQRRRDQLVFIQQGISESFAQSLVGRDIDVLVDGYNDDGWLIGRTQWDAPDVDPIVFISDPVDEGVAPCQVGEIRKCRVNGNSIFDLEVHPIA